MRDLRIKAPGQPPKFMTHNGGLALLPCTCTPGAILCMRDPETFIVSPERKDGAENLTQSRQDSDRVFSGDLSDPSGSLGRYPAATPNRPVRRFARSPLPAGHAVSPFRSIARSPLRRRSRHP
jgi:hypothetical protein